MPADNVDPMFVVMQELVKVMKRIQEPSNPSSTGLQGLHLQPYDETQETFTNYLQRLDNYITIRGLVTNTPEVNAQKVQIFINCLGPKTYQTLTSLTAPDLPNKKDFKTLTTLLKNHLSPQASEIAEQHKFLLRLQHEGESIANFVADLKMHTTNCNFICPSCKHSTTDTHLRSQFIRGVRDNDIRERLLQQKEDVNFQKIVELALAIETSKLESKQIQSPYRTESTHQTAVRSDSGNFTRKKYDNKNAARPKKLPSTQTTQPKPSFSMAHLRGKCFRCGDVSHKADKCRFINAVCNKCHTKGHIQSVCMKSGPTHTHVHQQQIVGENDIHHENLHNNTTTTTYTINSIETPQDSVPPKAVINVTIEGKYCSMELDTGATLSSMSLSSFRKICPTTPIEPTNIQLRGYFGEVRAALGKSYVNIQHGNATCRQHLYIFKEEVDTICGRQWLKELNVNTFTLNSVTPATFNQQQQNLLKQVFNDFSDLFTEEIGVVPDFRVTLKLKPGVQPIFVKPRQVPYAMLDRVDKEIDRLEGAGIIERVEYSPWGTPVVPVVKADNSIRLCADFKVTVNQHLLDDKYPIPNIEDIFARMTGGKYFCTLDVHQAYLHLQMDEESALLQTISTHKGPYKVLRLMFGVKVAPNLYQRFMDQTLQGLAGVACFFDDIVVQGETLQQLFQRLQAASG
jgi:hypothetical protein